LSRGALKKRTAAVFEHDDRPNQHSGASRREGSSIPITFGRSRQRLGAHLARWKASLSGASLRARFSVEPTRGPSFKQGPQ
jgi:hypothetical protein